MSDPTKTLRFTQQATPVSRTAISLCASSYRTLVYLAEATPEVSRNRKVGVAIGLQANDGRSVGCFGALQRFFKVFHALDVERLAAQALGDAVPSHRSHLGAEGPPIEPPFVRLLHRP